jgi:DNA-binding NarL/FixJ family response regulator
MISRMPSPTATGGRTGVGDIDEANALVQRDESPTDKFAATDRVRGRGVVMNQKPGVRGHGKQRILIVDDHAVLREGLAMVINQEPDLVVCGEAADAPEAIQAVAALQPDAVIADLSLTNGNGLELIKDVRTQHPDLPMLVLSLHDEALYAERVLRAGARGYIMKRASTTELLAALRKVLGGDVYLSERMASLLVTQAVGKRETPANEGPLGLLSDRELEVFQLLGEGHGTRKIARALGLSIKTISCYRQNIKSKLHLKDATELLHHAVQWTTDLHPHDPAQIGGHQNQG